MTTPAVEELDRALEALAAALEQESAQPSAEVADERARVTSPLTRSAVMRRVDRAAHAAQPTAVPLSTTLSVETTDLVLLAARLSQDLPDDLPDPGFRAALRAQLLGEPATGAASVVSDEPFAPLPAATLTLPTSAAPAATRQAAPRRRFPYFGAVTALAVVMVAAASVGTLAIWMNGDDNDDPPAIGNTGGVTPTLSIATEPGGAADDAATEANAGAVATSDSSTQPTEEPQPTPDGEEGEGGPSEGSQAPTADNEPTPEGAGVTPPAVTATVAPASTATLISTTPTVPSTQPTVVLLANVPPVDAAHMEQGPVPASDGSGPTPPREETNVELATTLPTPGASAPLYRLAPPSVDPELLVQEVASALGITGSVTEVQGVTGDQEWAASDDSGAHFQWDPDSGAFSFVAATDADAPTGNMDQSAALAAAERWLVEIGYPVDAMSLSAEPLELDPTLWVVNLSVDTVPHPGIGHPIGVMAHIDLSGRVVSASGYWLTLTTQEDAPLMTAQDAWATITDCKGIWTGGGVVGSGGDFRVDAIDVSYLLTTLGDGALVLQPVYRATGDFMTNDGSMSRISVFVQAVRGD